MRVLVVGPLWAGGTCFQRMHAMQVLGHEVLSVDTKPVDVQKKEKGLSYRVRRKFLGPPDLANANRHIIESINKYQFDVLWLDKALTIRPETLQAIRKISPQTIITGYSPDDMVAKHNQSISFLKSLPFYHIYFTTKSYGVKELEALGVERAYFIGNSFDPDTHRPMEVTPEQKEKYGGPVGFIGDYENERAQLLFFLAQHNIRVRIWGPNWNRKCRLSHSNMRIENKPLWADEYARAICSFDINLGFLRKINRDLQTDRSVEIPACGAFLLAERTSEHMALFKEGKEAEFFDTKEELLQKVNHYLENAKERVAIAKSGRERCIKDAYSNQDRIREMLSVIKNLHERN